MMVPTPDAAGSKKPDILADIVAQVLAIGATRFEVNQSYGQEEVWAVKGPVDFSVASFRSDSAKATELTRRLNDLEKNQTQVVVSGIEYLLGIEVFDSSGGGAFRVTINFGKK